MRVLYVNHTSRVSGGEHSLLSLLEALPPEVEATVACPEGALAGRVRAAGLPVLPIRGTDGSLRLHPARTPRAVLEMAQAALQVRRLAAASGAGLVHANSIRAGLIATAPPRGARRPTVVHVRDCLPEGRVAAASLRAIARADAVVANSAYTRSALGPAMPGAGVVYNAVDLERFERVRIDAASARTRLGLEENAGPVLAVVAQITPWKAQDDAIRVAGLLRSTHPGVRLLLVGAPKFDSAATRYDNAAYLDSLRRLAAELDIEDAVGFLGERDDVPEVLRAVDLLLVPSWEEPFGRAVIEAMASGVPVLATDVGGPPEILGDAECGLALPPRRPRLWAEEIERLLADPARLAAMGARGREEARRRFGIQRHVEAVLEAYERALAATAG
jgi:glycosyltransferase involved in cell wall biosynthesis